MTKKRKKLSRLAEEGLRAAGIDPESSWTAAGGPGGTFSSEFFSWLEEQNIIARYRARKQLEDARRGARKNQNDLAIWREFQRRRPNSKKSDSALIEEIGRKFELRRSAAIEACKRGKKLSGR
jgi:hypothetical protein